MSVIISYDDLSRDFKLDCIEPNIIITSIKHRVSLIESRELVYSPWEIQYPHNYDFSNYCVICDKWDYLNDYCNCIKCYDEKYNQQQRDSKTLRFIGRKWEYRLQIHIYKKEHNSLCFEMIETKYTGSTTVGYNNIYRAFNIKKLEWWNYDNDINKIICDTFAFKIMIIRDFMYFDVWCYVVDILIKSEKTRNVTFG
jgi:hypothetical protein